MSFIFEPIPCATPTNPRAWAEFLEMPLLHKQCDSMLPRSQKFFVCLTTVALLVLGTVQIFRLCLLPPNVGKEKNNQFTDDEVVILKYLKFNFHDISLITKAVSLYSNLMLLHDVVTEDHNSLLNSIGFNASMLFLRIVFTLFAYGLGIIKGDCGTLVREGSLYAMLIFHLIQLSCVTQNFYKRCTCFI